MPIYEFACKTCHTEFEVRVSRVGDRPDACPSCGGAELEKQLSTFAPRTGSAGTGDPAAMSACSMGSACGRVTGRGCGGGN